MPAPPKTSESEIVAAARQLIARDGAEALSMQSLAEAVGIRAPSLYKRFQDRQAILRAVQLLEIATLGEAARALPTTETAPERIRALAALLWERAHAEPHLHRLIFSASPAQTSEAAAFDRRARSTMLEPLMGACVEMVGADQGLLAARAFTAYVHGFISMHLDGGFHLHGDIASAFAFGLNSLLQAWQTVSPQHLSQENHI